MIDAKGDMRFDPIRKYLPGVPPAVDSFIARLLQAHPEDRYASAREAREAFWLACGHAGRPSRSATPVTSPAESAVPPSMSAADVKRLYAARREAGEPPVPEAYRSPAPEIRSRPSPLEDMDAYMPREVVESGLAEPGAFILPASRFPVEPVIPDRGSAEHGVGPCLRVLDGPNADSLIAIPPKGVSVARMELNPEDTSISRIHARLVVRRGTLVVLARDALNGVHVGGRRLRKACVKPGREFMMGMTRLRFEYDGGK